MHQESSQAPLEADLLLKWNNHSRQPDAAMESQVMLLLHLVHAAQTCQGHTSNCQAGQSQVKKPHGHTDKHQLPGSSGAEERHSLAKALCMKPRPCACKYGCSVLTICKVATFAGPQKLALVSPSLLQGPQPLSSCPGSFCSQLTQATGQDHYTTPDLGQVVLASTALHVPALPLLGHTQPTTAQLHSRCPCSRSHLRGPRPLCPSPARHHHVLALPLLPGLLLAHGHLPQLLLLLLQRVPRGGRGPRHLGIRLAVTRHLPLHRGGPHLHHRLMTQCVAP